MKVVVFYYCNTIVTALISLCKNKVIFLNIDDIYDLCNIMQEIVSFIKKIQIEKIFEYRKSNVSYSDSDEDI